MSATTKVPLSSVVIKTTGGGTPERDNPEFWNGGIPWASVKDFKDGIYRLSKTKEEISEKGLKRSASHLIPAGTPIICTRMAVGRIARASVPVAINQDLRALHIRDEFDTDYVVWAVDSIRHRIENLAIGSTVKGISIDQLLSFEIEAPPKPEQTKIAEILSTVDRAIEQTEALIAKQQRLKTGLMQDLLTRGIDEHGNLRSEHTHEFKDSPLGRIPVEWEVKPMGQVSTLITNGFVGVATPYYTESSDGVPYLYGNNIRCNRMDMRKLTRITRQFHERQQKSQLNPGDMLTVQSGHIGTTAVVPDDLPESNCHALILTKFKKDLLDPNFVSFYCNFCLETGTMGHLFVGSTIKHINTSDFAKFAIPFPSKDEQSKIAKRLLDLNFSIDGSAQGLSKLRALKTALMQDLLTGRKRVTDLLGRKEAIA